MKALITRLRARHADQSGYVAILVAAFMSTVFFGLAAISVDVAHFYVEVGRVQKAADAGALAGVTYMPQDLASATASAKDVTARNGYKDGTSGIAVNAAGGQTPGQLDVSVSSTVSNAFGSFFGMRNTTITRHAVADYSGPQPMGSPCNTLGNEPNGTATFGPLASVLMAPTGASCARFPEFWPSIAGPEVAKTQGDENATRYCSGTESECSGTTNTAFDPLGYFMVVKVQQAMVNQVLHLQVYDPAYVATGSECADIPSTLSDSAATNVVNTFLTDAKTRYDNAAGDFCSGDNQNAGTGQRRGSEVPTVTSFGLRAPSDTFDPKKAAPVAGCVRQYPGYTAPTKNQLTSSNPNFDDSLARVFHQWKELCTFQPTRAGDYYLQVRTNVALGGAVNNDGSYKPTNADNSAMFTQTGDDTSVKGNGTNRFAVRVYSDGGSNSNVSVSAYQRMPIFANTSSSAPEFNLIRVLPGAAGKSLNFSFYDVGDAATSATLTVLRPGDATGSTLSGCKSSGYQAAALPSCSLSGISNSSGWNGQRETISVPIPGNYSCNYASSGGCWFKVRVSFGSGSVTDATTWSANISGDPVRLVE